MLMKKSKSLYSDLHDIFNGVKEDDEAYLQFLNDEPTRKKFDRWKPCKNGGEYGSQDFVHEFKHIDTYRLELKKFLNIRKTTSLRYAEDVDFNKYKQSLIKIMDTNIKAEEAELLTRQISINDKKVF